MFLSACSPAPPHIVVEWTTATEMNTAGFNLYRGSQPDGPFVKLNANLIPASTDPLSGGKYQYVDSNVISGETYYYKLEDVDLQGAKEEHGPITITAPVDARYGYWLAAAGGLVIAVLGVVILRARRNARSTAA